MPGHWEILLILLVVVLLFGSGRISSLMGDVAKGIKSFKKGLSDDASRQTTDKAVSNQSKTETGDSQTDKS